MKAKRQTAPTFEAAWAEHYTARGRRVPPVPDHVRARAEHFRRIYGASGFAAFLDAKNAGLL